MPMNLSSMNSKKNRRVKDMPPWKRKRLYCYRCGAYVKTVAKAKTNGLKAICAKCQEKR